MLPGGKKLITIVITIQPMGNMNVIRTVPGICLIMSRLTNEEPWTMNLNAWDVSPKTTNVNLLVHQINSRGFIKGSRIHPLGYMNAYRECPGNPSHSCWDIAVWSNAVDGLTDQPFFLDRCRYKQIHCRPNRNIQIKCVGKMILLSSELLNVPICLPTICKYTHLFCLYSS